MTGGRGAAWDLHDRCTPDGDIPTRRQLWWNTRRVDQKQSAHYWSEPGRAGVVPAVEAWLMRVTITRWIGPPVVVWIVDGQVQVYDHHGRVRTYESCHAWASETDARQDFDAHRHIRPRLAGESTTPTRPGPPQ